LNIYYLFYDELLIAAVIFNKLYNNMAEIHIKYTFKIRPAYCYNIYNCWKFLYYSSSYIL